MTGHSTPTQRIEYGLDTIPVDRTVTVGLRDLMYIHQTLSELIRFFHQPAHYPDLQAIENFLGSRGSGDAFDALVEAQYHRIRDMIPADINDAFGEGERFDHPLLPAYYST